MQFIHAKAAPEAIGIYSHAVKINDTVYLSGQVGISPKTLQLCSDNVFDQLKQIFENLRAVCLESGGDLKNIVKLTVYLTDINDFQLVNNVMQEYFNTPYPSPFMLEVSKLPKSAKVEIDAIMVII